MRVEGDLGPGAEAQPGDLLILDRSQPPQPGCLVGGAAIAGSLQGLGTALDLEPTPSPPVQTKGRIRIALTNLLPPLEGLSRGSSIGRKAIAAGWRPF